MDCNSINIKIVVVNQGGKKQKGLGGNGGIVRQGNWDSREKGL